MSSDAIEQLLAGRWRDPDTGALLGVPIRAIAIEPSLDGHHADLVAALDLGRRLAVVSDPTTAAVLGERVERALSAIGRVDCVRLPEHPHADAGTAERVRQATGPADALVAVGSGTINDLCKYAAFRDGKPYVVFGTAPSMNGYCSATAALTVDGVKRSLPARPAAGVFLDLGILAAAPKRMICSGLGDSLCRPTAQADWLLSHLLRGTDYREAPFALLLPEEAALFGETAALLAGDRAAMARLARTLVLSGLGMVLIGSSHPASEGEHSIAHYAEMTGAADLPERFHGEQIGVTTLTMARLQARVLGGTPEVRPTRVDRVEIEAHFGPRIGAACAAELAAKALSSAEADRINDAIAREWDRIRNRLAAVTPPIAVLERALAAAGAPTTAAALGWPAAFYRTAIRRARQIRNRFTFLDLADDAGVLDAFAEAEG